MILTPTTLWGLTPAELHDRYWASHGVQVVRQGQAGAIDKRAELFLLTDARSLTLFDLASPVEVLCWVKPRLLTVRLQDRRERGYRERAVMDDQRQFLRFERLYGAADSRLGRVALTKEGGLACAWRDAPTPRQGWRAVRHATCRRTRHVLFVPGSVFDREVEQDLLGFSRRLVQVWRRPDSTIHRARRHDAFVWIDADIQIDTSTRFIGPVWVGTGRRFEEPASIVGPSILWDDPRRRPMVDTIEWGQIEPTQLPNGPVRARPASSMNRRAKRAFDLVFSLLALLATLPLYPLVLLAIWLEDGRPFFFIHPRETVGGREFPCIKFRSMRREADTLKPKLYGQNQADGPQFFIENDPRLTRVGRFLRDWNIDELPQFINVLLGHMSVVGPRPSPYHENQCCPPWREARLSVRPGVTGLWQVMRTRRLGCDFQEWIKFDIEYVESASWRLDLWIIWRTLGVIFF